MPRVKTARRKVEYIQTILKRRGGDLITCNQCGYTGEADLIESTALGSGYLERCPVCKSKNFSYKEFVMPWITDEWKGCYPSSWKGMIVPQAMSHPAKFSSKLIRRIYEHMRAEGWVISGDVLTVDENLLEYITCHEKLNLAKTAGSQPSTPDAVSVQGLKQERTNSQTDQRQYARSAGNNSISHHPIQKSTAAQSVGITGTELSKKEHAQFAESNSHIETKGEFSVPENVMESPLLGTKEKGERNKPTEHTRRQTQEYQDRLTGNGEVELTNNITESSGRNLAENSGKKSEDVRNVDQQKIYRFTTKSRTDTVRATTERTWRFYVLPVTEKLISLLIGQCPSFSQPGSQAFLRDSHEITFIGLSDLRVGDEIRIPPSKIIDPFGGVALGSLDAMRLGLEWFGVELELKFVDLGQHNIANWDAKFHNMPKWGKAVLCQGDSRKLLQVLRGNSSVAATISSPPYSETDLGGGAGILARDEKMRETHGMTVENVNYGKENGNLGNMRGDGFSAAISSPPFRHSEGGTPEPKPGGSIDKKLYERHAAGNSAAEGYGGSDGQLANMGEGDESFEAAMKSPPYEGDVVKARSSHLEVERTARKGMDRTPGMTRELLAQEQYGTSEGQLGNDSGDDFWMAARQIVEQVYLALAPGGHAVWVTKRYVKNKQIVEFSDQWRQLCEAVGFKTVHWHRALLVRDNGKSETLDGNTVHHKTESKSFFRRLAEKRGSPRIDWEDVLCMVKE